jgi:DNA-binding XRE family transcriptional regulator
VKFCCQGSPIFTWDLLILAAHQSELVPESSYCKGRCQFGGKMRQPYARSALQVSRFKTVSLASGVSWNETVGNRLRDFREAQGLTQTQLARRAGLLQSHISRLENGENSFTERSLNKIAKALGIRPEQIDPAFGLARCRTVS